MSNLPKRMWLKEQLSEEEQEQYQNIFTQISGADFIQIMNRLFVPFIKNQGFKGAKNNFYKKNKPWIYTVNIFKDNYGGRCAVNVGVHLDYIENAVGRLPTPSKFTVNDCIITKNIPLDNNNSWYYYGKNEEEGIKTVHLMIKMIEEKGIPFFNKFKDYPKPFSLITIEDIMNPNERFAEYEISKEKLAWIRFHFFLAKFNIKTEQYELAKQILEKAWNDEYYSDRYTKHGVSPLLKEIDELKQKLPIK